MSTFLSFTSIDLLFPHLLQLLHLPLVNSPSGLTAQLFSRLTHREQQRQRTLNTGPYFYFVSSFGFVVLLCVLASPVGYDGSHVSVGFWSLRWLYIHFFPVFFSCFFFKISLVGSGFTGNHVEERGGGEQADRKYLQGECVHNRCPPHTHTHVHSNTHSHVCPHCNLLHLFYFTSSPKKTFTVILVSL